MDLIDRNADDAFVQLSLTADRFEKYDRTHASRIATIADAIACVFQLANHDRGSLRAAALLHDIGEVAMERDYIARADTLSDDEQSDLARHPIIGEREASRVGADRAAQLLVRWHHEWFNGAGYPDALRRDEIPLAARILRLADTYVALTDNRPYRTAMTSQSARSEIRTRAGIEFDPAVVKIFLSLSEFPELVSTADGHSIGQQARTGKSSFDLFSSFMR
jgi:HD-GYP domain-containing protein (c-di-GMP phosphodiesterase class II)